MQRCPRRVGVFPISALLASLVGAAIAHADPLERELGRVVELHGWPCGAIVAAEPVANDTYAATCGDGNRYEIFLSPRWRSRDADRQTGLRVMLDVAAEVRRLDAADAPERRAAADRLAELGPAAGSAVPDLIDALGDPDAGVRAAAATAIGRIGTDDPQARRALEGATRDADGEVRRNASAALARLGGG